MEYNNSYKIKGMADWFKKKKGMYSFISQSFDNLQAVCPKLLKTEVAYQNDFPYTAEIISEGLTVPWAMDITKDGRIFVTERIGNIRLIHKDNRGAETIYTFTAPFTAQGEGGLLGLVLDPEFDKNGYFYVMYTFQAEDKFYNRVVRMHYEDGNTREDRILLDNIPGGRGHNGGRIKIGPDNLLYITTGDGDVPESSQNLELLSGKILRINLDGSIPSDNPFSGSPVYALGLRNPQGLAWSKEGDLYASVHGNYGRDKINIIIPGGNYGWPLAEAEEDLAEQGFQASVISSETETWAPSGITFIEEGPLKGRLLVAALRGMEVLEMMLSADGRQVVQVIPRLQDQYGRLREAYSAADGSVYITTSNLDGRGQPREGDDKIIRLVPISEE
ncbi:PQQ-dependent sugar dehydrogenase [Anaerocolumna sp. AGMB13020]|uniref:PQQ-dependent sugar dehydrogenase n=1 Tax=Anaerocolumna sp. AGMB13020 TaxID=3081750 RepID=UPI002952E8B0|nr:PQQ-dependent sugar dehydrogenase [Anaerocolumna sp. AGMB13020]WOO36878.1 PQQ-dependent sugar dehydrogenase [Anaerocolumna sp. AGMB13020]